MMRNKNHPDHLEVVANQKIKEKNYWLDKLSGEWVKSTFPYSCERVKAENLAGDDFHLERFRFPGELFSALMTLSSRKDIKLYIILAAGLVLLVNKYNTFTGGGDITMGSPIYKQDIEGEFVNTVLVLRNRVPGEMTFKELLFQVRQTIIEANGNCNYPVEVLAKQLGKPYSEEDDFPLFDIVFLLENIQDEAYIRHINCNVRFLFKREKEYIEGVVEYNPILYDKWSIEKIIGHFIVIFQQVLFNLDLEIFNIDILPVEEKQQILNDFNATGTAYPQDKTIHELFAAQVEKTPDGVSLVGSWQLAVGKEERIQEPIQLTYRQLNEKADQLAYFLREKGVGPDTVVGIMMETGLEIITGILGILKAGGAYLPIDPHYPRERIDYMLKDSNAKILLTELPEGHKLHHSSHQFIIHHSSNLAYVIYTSGSTGRPKGVMVEHRSVVRLVKNTGYIRFREGDRLLQTGAVEFDVSTFEIWGPLLNGMSLYLVPKEDILASERLEEIIRKYGIVTMWLTSPLFSQLSGIDIEIFKGLRNLLVGGDVLSPVHIEKVRVRFPRLNIINGYGPTENTTFSTTFLIRREYKGRIPIGRPISNSRAFIVDEAGVLAPVGVPGELWVGGDGVSRGYLNRPGLTNEKFDQDLWDHQDYRDENQKFLRGGPGGAVFSKSAPPGGRRQKLYKTGDLARWLPDGNIDFIGRIDQQVKIRGFRIELGEIEHQLQKIKGISEAVVIVREDRIIKQKYLCAYIVSKSGIDPQAIKDTLVRALPAYMVPAYVVPVDHIPLTANGKVDRGALPVPGSGLKAGGDYAAPGNETEEKMVEIWAEILGLDKKIIGVKDNFFERGGDSLKAAILEAKIHKVFNVRVFMEDIFRAPSVEGLCSLIAVTDWAREQDRGLDVLSGPEEEEIIL